MSPELITILMIVSLVVVVLTGFPITFGIATIGLTFGLLGMGHAYLTMVPMRVMTGTLAEYIFAAVPLFVFMGTLLSSAGIAEMAYGVMYKWMAGLRGGLALATIIVCTIFAACTGIIGASVTAMGLLAVPAMLKRGYNKPLVGGSVCAGGTLGILIPPSIMLIIYAPMAGVSVVGMFAGAIFPGLILSALFIGYILIACYRKPDLGPPLPLEERVKFWTKKSLGEGAIYLFPPVVLILAVLGSIFFGVASPTEAGAMGSIAAIILGLAYRKLNWANFKSAVYTTARISVMIIFIALAATLFTGAFLGSGCGTVVANFLLGLPLGRWGVFLMMLLIIFIMGMFLDWVGIVMIMVPIFGPIVIALGFDPLWAGLVVCVSLQMSFLTPPFAYAIFYLKGLDVGLDLPDLYRGIIPFVILQAIGVALCIIFPQIPMYLPGLLK